jgi:methylated-DNA-[protein]-cysteine S-methyltransferase
LNIYFEYSSPLGVLLLSSDGECLTGVHIPYNGDNGEKRGRHAPEAPIFVEAVRQLDAYFRGDRITFDLPLAPAGTEFQKQVWKALQGIPYGETTSYGEIARRIGRPEAVRAVGAANGSNPIAIIIPCHRVIGASGKLVGYGGGLSNKQALLDLESSLFSSARR